ncbi:hypothetical protein PIB30_031756 [Stylosanthes scabra]|uniref:Uncharacterized protein n=1 Tax=Stylosanthes scabra TaxID=79078 RepID=A0ABU6VA09_9FABA|nr:hypothetical protein [Stylosanthes scabra]
MGWGDLVNHNFTKCDMTSYLSTTKDGNFLRHGGYPLIKQGGAGVEVPAPWTLASILSLTDSHPLLTILLKLTHSPHRHPHSSPPVRHASIATTLKSHCAPPPPPATANLQRGSHQARLCIVNLVSIAPLLCASSPLETRCFPLLQSR